PSSTRCANVLPRKGIDRTRTCKRLRHVAGFPHEPTMPTAHAAAPVVIVFLPSPASSGTSVTITGIGFDDPSTATGSVNGTSLWRASPRREGAVDAVVPIAPGGGDRVFRGPSVILGAQGDRPMVSDTSQRVSTESRPADVLVVFGITGNLAKVMTFRSLYRLERRKLLDCPIVGVAAEGWTIDKLHEYARDSIEGTGEALDEEVFDRFAERLSYVQGDLSDAATYGRVADAIK